MGKRVKIALSGGAAGLINGFFGGGGGMVLLPLLTRRCGVEERRAFANCVAVILPLSALSAAIYWWKAGIDLYAALPYLIGGLAGGALGGKLFNKVPVVWLRRIFAAFLLYGGVRYLI
ncbi:MAG: sulfite exporter TauE/SafE family protein [Oscillospiraceae bacterium]|nr:sulfite exporter TauE/SafE family protein [Oscillospiraceae bacterium]